MRAKKRMGGREEWLPLAFFSFRRRRVLSIANLAA